MRKRILAMLQFMNIYEVEQPNKGRIHIDKEALTREVEKNGGKIIFDEDGYKRWKQKETTANQIPSAPQISRNRNGAPRRDEDLGIGELNRRVDDSAAQERDISGGKNASARRDGGVADESLSPGVTSGSMHGQARPRDYSGGRDNDRGGEGARANRAHSDGVTSQHFARDEAKPPPQDFGPISHSHSYERDGNYRNASMKTRDRSRSRSPDRRPCNRRERLHDGGNWSRYATHDHDNNESLHRRSHSPSFEHHRDNSQRERGAAKGRNKQPHRYESHSGDYHHFSDRESNRGPANMHNETGNPDRTSRDYNPQGGSVGKKEFYGSGLNRNDRRGYDV